MNCAELLTCPLFEANINTKNGGNYYGRNTHHSENPQKLQSL